MANPDTRARIDPTAVAESGSRFGSPQLVHGVWRAWAMIDGMGSVGPAVP